MFDINCSSSICHWCLWLANWDCHGDLSSWRQLGKGLLQCHFTDGLHEAYNPAYNLAYNTVELFEDTNQGELYWNSWSRHPHHGCNLPRILTGQLVKQKGSFPIACIDNLFTDHFVPEVPAMPCLIRQLRIVPGCRNHDQWNGKGILICTTFVMECYTC